jgi:hypothetical protein
MCIKQELKTPNIAENQKQPVEAPVVLAEGTTQREASGAGCGPDAAADRA